MNTATPGPDLSIVIPIDDDHGYGEACVRSWNEQQFAREKLQLIIVDPGHRETLRRKLTPHLAAHDLIISVPDDNEGLLYGRGAEAAQSGLIFMTEGHCVAEPWAAEETIRLFQDPEVAAVNGSATHIEPTTMARQQTLLEKEWLAAWPRGHWQTISLRAFAIRRRVYHQLGGFRPEHRRFCANALVIDLDRLGLRLAPTPRPVVRHVNSLTIRDVIVTLRDCARGQIVWRAALERGDQSSIAENSLGGLDFWSRRGDLARPTARSLAHALAQSLSGDCSKSAWSALPRLLGACLLGPRVSSWTQRARLAAATLLCAAASLHKHGLRAAYLRLWRQSFNSGFADFAALEPVTPAWFAPLRTSLDLRSLPPGATAGLYAPETWGPGGPMIRWSGPVFLLRLELSPNDSHSIVLDVRSDVPAGHRCLDAFYNGARLPKSSFDESTDQVRIHLPSAAALRHGRQELIVTCRTERPSDRGSADPRDLGLALFGLHLETKEAGAPLSFVEREKLSLAERSEPVEVKSS